MGAGIMPWLWCGLLLAPVPARAASEACYVPPASVGCAQPGALHRADNLPAGPGQAHALAQLHCQRVATGGEWELLGHHADTVLLRHLSASRGAISLYFLASTVRPASGLAVGLMRLVLVGIAATLLWPFMRYGWRWLRRRRAWRLCIRMVNRHADALRIRRRQLVQINSYGVERTGRWRREQAEFIKTVIQPALRRSRLEGVWPSIARTVLARIEQVARQPLAGAGNRHEDARYTPDMDPIAYERFCAASLRAAGWDARATQPGSDQGADVIATRGRLRLVVQCKLYRSAVGNEAVQQVSAARMHYRGNVAAVVSNADYTASARALARSNDVFLLHHEELPAFAARLARVRGKAFMS
ncbi:restriction endonuclease [Komagataeibacter saccharivorans]|uniref:restriction endonuclease n=1 Tax=Komagataeibacter saccharivorans TaxID=265959 RepID=UPI000C82A031|nr:restriction endonuclease [Komagataeibacter saccharivorans]